MNRVDICITGPGVLFEFFHQHIADCVGGICPPVDDLASALIVGDHTILVSLLYRFDLNLCGLDVSKLILGHTQVIGTE